MDVAWFGISLRLYIELPLSHIYNFMGVVGGGEGRIKAVFVKPVFPPKARVTAFTSQVLYTKAL